MKKDLIINNDDNKVEINVKYNNDTDEDIDDIYYTNVEDSTIKNIESLIRSSYEYDKIVLLYKNVCNLDKSTYFPRFNLRDGYKLELHHSPFTLFEIVQTICNKQLYTNGKFSDFSVAEETMLLHYENKIGLMPVDPTSHELIHSQSLTVHPSIPIGDWKLFIKEYSEYMEDSLLEKIKNLEKLEKTDINKDSYLFKEKKTIIKDTNIEKLKDLDLTKLLPNFINKGLLK